MDDDVTQSLPAVVRHLVPQPKFVGTETVDPITGLSAARAALAVDELSRLHARWWDRESELAADWLPRSDPATMRAYGAMLPGSLPAFLEATADVIGDPDVMRMPDDVPTALPPLDAPALDLSVAAAAVAALYAFIMQRYIHRDIPSMREVVKVTADSVGLVGGVLVILAVAVGLTNYMINAQIPDALIAWTTEHIESPLMFLLALNVFLLLVGCVMDVFSAIVVVVPLISGVAEAYQIDPIHLGIIFVANLELGYLTPPLGLNLLVASVRFERPALEVMRATLPMLAILTIAVLLITYFPWLTLAPLQWFGRIPY